MIPRDAEADSCVLKRKVDDITQEKFNIRKKLYETEVKIGEKTTEAASWKDCCEKYSDQANAASQNHKGQVWS